MIATSHAIIGGALGLIVGSSIQNPIAGAATALAVGAVSHLLCDRLPHLDLPPKAKFIGDDVVWDKALYIFAITDTVVAFLFTLGVWYFKFDLNFASVYAWGAFGGYLPDFVDNFPLWRDQIHQLPFFKQFHKFHIAVHHTWWFKYPMPKYWILGTLTQVVTVGACLIYLFKTGFVG